MELYEAHVVRKTLPKRVEGSEKELFCTVSITFYRWDKNKRKFVRMNTIRDVPVTIRFSGRHSDFKDSIIHIEDTSSIKVPEEDLESLVKELGTINFSVVEEAWVFSKPFKASSV